MNEKFLPISNIISKTDWSNILEIVDWSNTEIFHNELNQRYFNCSSFKAAQPKQDYLARDNLAVM